jgi:hypothetical protein
VPVGPREALIEGTGAGERHGRREQHESLHIGVRVVPPQTRALQVAGETAPHVAAQEPWRAREHHSHGEEPAIAEALGEGACLGLETVGLLGRYPRASPELQKPNSSPYAQFEALRAAWVQGVVATPI